MIECKACVFKLIVRGINVANTSVGEIGQTAEQVRDDERAGAEDDNGTVDHRACGAACHQEQHAYERPT